MHYSTACLAALGVAACNISPAGTPAIAAGGGGGVGAGVGGSIGDAGFQFHSLPCPNAGDAASVQLEAEPDNTDTPDAAANRCPRCSAQTYYRLLTAKEVSETLGANVRFLSIDSHRDAILGEIVETHESVYVQVNTFAGCQRNEYRVLRMPDAMRDWELFPGPVACKALECARLQVNSGVDTLVIDTVTTPAITKDSFADLSHHSQAWMPACDSPLIFQDPEEQGVLDYAYNNHIFGTTDVGTVQRVVTGNTPCCCPLTPQLGSVIDFTLVYCGISLNWRLLTEDTLWGTVGCAID